MGRLSRLENNGLPITMGVNQFIKDDDVVEKFSAKATD